MKAFFGVAVVLLLSAHASANANSWFNPGGTSGPFSPSDIAGLQLWFDAQDAASLGSPSNGDPIAAWSDKSGNSRTASQATSAARPIYSTTGLNGFPALKFNNNVVPALFLDMGNGFTLFNPASAFTVLVVINGVSFGGSVAPQFLTLATTSDGSFRFGFATGVSGLDDMFFGVGNATWNNFNFAYPGGTTIASNFRLTYGYDGVSPTTASSFPTYYNGSPVTIASGLAAYAPSVSNLIGCQGGMINCFNGYVGEILVYSGLLNSTQLGQLNTYENAKWGF